MIKVWLYLGLLYEIPDGGGVGFFECFPNLLLLGNKAIVSGDYGFFRRILGATVIGEHNMNTIIAYGQAQTTLIPFKKKVLMT
jgi:hypothetical protein